ncbi:MAG: NAD(P)H-dependent flavin oxidoreductase [Acidobacteriota bacterium]
MGKREFSPLRIGDWVATLPVIQGGMGVGISLSSLASAVADEGGVGTIAAVGIGMGEPDVYTNFIEANVRALKREIRKARERTRGLLAVNVMVAMTNYAQMVRAAVEEKIDLILSGAGLPLDLPKYLDSGCRTRLAPIVSSGRAATILCKRWLERFGRAPDAIVVEGPLAGGHLGFKPEDLTQPSNALEILVPEVVDAVRAFEDRAERPIPVVAAGGVYSGGDILKFERLGASGVQMATRFVTTHECDAAPAFKEAYLNAREGDIGIIQSPVGLPGRAIRNAFLDSVEAGEKSPFKCPYHCITTCDYKTAPYCIALALVNAQKGNLRSGFAFAGANAFRAQGILSVRQIVEALRREYEEAAS